MTAVLLLSNGHGEDLSGALVGQELARRGLTVEALPLVGHGTPYRRAGIPVLGDTRTFSTGGLGYTSLAGRLTEARQGQALYLLARLGLLLRLRRRYALVVAVGDVVPVAAAWLAGRPGAVYLVAYSSHYEGRLRLPWPCGWLLRRPRLRQVWSRDALTSADLSRQLGREVRFLGNPFLDPVAAAAPESPELPGRRRDAPPALALLPGSRLPEALGNLERMLAVLLLLPAPLLRPGALTLRAALVRDLTPEAIARRAAPLGWRLEEGPALGREGLRLELHHGRFAAVLGAADLVLASTGTAAEQAVGLGKPVLQVVGTGPQFTAGFADAQRRLLGPGVYWAAGPPGEPATLAATAAMAARLLERLDAPQEGEAWRRQLADEGRLRLGTPGGTRRMADAIMELLSSTDGRPR